MNLLHAVLAGLQVLAGGAILNDVIGLKWAGFLVLVVGAIQAGLVAYEKGLRTPVPGAE